MADAGTMIIPYLKDSNEEQVKSLKDILTTLEENGQTVSADDKKALAQREEQLKLERQAKVREEKNLELLNLIAPPPRVAKIQQKLTLMYYKHVVGGKLLQTIKKGLGKLTEKAGNMFFDIIKLLLIGAMFPGLLEMLIDIFINISVMIINMLAKNLPRIIKKMIEIVTVILPAALIKAIDAIFPALGNMFNELFKGTQFEFLGRWLKEAFGPDGVLTAFAKGLAELAPFFLAGVLILGAYSKAMALFNIIMAANPVVLIIVGLVAAFVILWKWGDKIMGFMDNLPKMLEEKFGFIGKIFGTIIDGIYGVFRPIIQFIQDIKDGKGIGESLWNLFTGLLSGILNLVLAIPKVLWDLLSGLGGLIWEGLVALWEPVGAFFSGIWESVAGWFSKKWKQIIGFYSGIYKKIKTGIVKVIDFYKGIFQKVSSVFRSIITPVIEVMSPIFSKIKEVLGDVWDLIANTIGAAFDAIYYGISDMVTWFEAFGEEGITGDIGARSAAIKLAEAEAEAQGLSDAQVEARTEAIYQNIINEKTTEEAVEARVSNYRASKPTQGFGEHPNSTAETAR